MDDDDEANKARHHIIPVDVDAGDLTSYMEESDTSSCIKQETDTDDDSYNGIEYNDISCLCIDPIPDTVISNPDVKMIDLKKQFLQDDNSATTLLTSRSSEPGLPIEPETK
jgi:hypothetical protein